jgi:hypothetical protein
MIDLQKYCSDNSFRLNLHRPFSQGDYTYATNGEFLIRVPLRQDVPQRNEPDASRAWPKYEPDAWRCPLAFDFPEPETALCDECFDGHQHACPDCECVCEECDGIGEIPVIRCVKLRETLIQEKYARLMLELPELEIEHQPPMMGPVQFRFDGGRGLVMPYTPRNRDGVPIIGTMMETPDP